jgi:mycoredoxin-dependent peroxiredoxin
VAQIGAAAPELALRDQHGQEQTLAARLGTRNVLLVFYPFAFTGVCTGELRALADHAGAWDDLRTDVIAVSCDSVPALRAFAEQEKLDFPLASDGWPHGKVAMSYDAFDSSLGCARRATYVIDRDGIIRWAVCTAIPHARNVADYLEALDGL